jgi:SAM-dependent methyltransferase
MNFRELFKQFEGFGNPSVILFRGVELKLLRQAWGRVLKQGQRVLDLGCGDGRTAQIVFEKAISYGLDNDNRSLEKAKKKKIYQRLLLAEAGKMPLENGVCDLVFSNCVVEHIKDLEPVFAEVNRVLKKGGLLVFTSLTENFKNYSLLSWLGLKKTSPLVRYYARFREKILIHYHGYSLAGWQKRLKRYGLELEDHFYYLNKKTIEQWDFFMLWSHFWSRISPRLDWWLYQHLLRNWVYTLVKKAEPETKKAGAIAIMARKSR